MGKLEKPGQHLKKIEKIFENFKEIMKEFRRNRKQRFT